MHQDSNQTGSQDQGTLSAYGWGEPFQTAFDEIAPGDGSGAGKGIVQRVLVHHRASR